MWPDIATKLKPLGDGFIKLIKMIIAPLIFCVVVHGIVGAGDLRKVGRVGAKAIIYFEVVTTIALVMGLAIAYFFAPGHGMNIDPATLDGRALEGYAERVTQVQGGIVDFLMRIIPTTVVDAFAKGDTLQVLLFAVLFGAGLSLLGERGKPVAQVISLADRNPCSRLLASSSAWRLSACSARLPLPSANTVSRRSSSLAISWCCST